MRKTSIYLGQVIKYHIINTMLAIFFIVPGSFCQIERYTITDTIMIKETKRKLLYKNAGKWFNFDPYVKMINSDKKSGVLNGRGYMVYVNKVIVENVFVSRYAAEKTEGNIYFTVDLKIINDSVYFIRFTNFKHKAYPLGYGETSLGFLTSYRSPAPWNCQEDEEWCTAVWNDMKRKCREAIEIKLLKLRNINYN